MAIYAQELQKKLVRSEIKVSYLKLLNIYTIVEKLNLNTTVRVRTNFLKVV